MKGIKDITTGKFIKNNKPKNCVICSNSFITYSKKQNTCSRKCGQILRSRIYLNPLKGKSRSQEIKEKISRAHIGMKSSPEAIEKMRLSKLGKPRGGDPKNWKHKEETKLKFRLRKGQKSPGWKGGLTSLIRLIRRGIVYRTWRTNVFKRDNWTCVWCGANKKYLQVHHIKQFALMLRENNIKTVEDAEACDVLWDTNNGRTLCIDCHKETDTYLNKGKQYLKTYGL